MHLTDEQLNECIDNEIKDRAQVELHLSSCEDCAARFAALRALFDEIESLPEVTLSHDIATPVTRNLSGRATLPRSLHLTVILQATAVVIVILFAAPFVGGWISPSLSNIQAPSITDAFLQLQSQWMIWLDILSQFQVPSLPKIPVIELSSLSVMLTVISASLLWLIGNRLLLRNQMK
jgi:anti-sigma factor RsiW